MQRIPLNDGWTFHRNGGAGVAVVLPHDAMIGAPRSADAPSTGEQGNFEGGTYRYERQLDCPAGWAGQRVLLQFGGVYRHACVTLNGVEVGRCAYGWTLFFCDLSEALVPGSDNLLAVTCDNAAQPDSRFYTGAGIFRQVWLWHGPAEGGVTPEGVRLHTVSLDPVRVQVDVEGNLDDVAVELLDGEAVVAQAEGSHVTLVVPNAHLWSADDPYLYQWRVTSRINNATVDTHSGTFGIRQLAWSTDGFFVNGERTILRGGCVHADNGILGAAAWPEADRRRVRMLKEAGFNALRSSHNPASDAMVEACDEYGLYLIDEGWDQWFFHKNPHDYAAEWREHHLTDLDAMVARGYNHPSIVMWSIGNEVSEPCVEEGLDAIDEMVAHLHAADDTRPVTCAINLTILGGSAMGNPIYNAEEGGSEMEGGGLDSSSFNAFSQVVGTVMVHIADLPSFDRACSPALDRLDISGYNYALGRYALDRRLHPERIICGTETLWGDVVRTWRYMQKHPHVIGDFCWSAWDYLGEAGCGAWTYNDPDTAFQKSYPWLLANQGAIDICGAPNAELFLAQAAWGMAHERPRIAVRPLGRGAQPFRAVWRFSNGIPSWSWQGCEGEQAVIEVFCDAPVVELKLNGRVLSRKRPHGCICRWRVPYQPGELVATALTAHGEELGQTVLRSADATSVRIRLLAEAADCEEQELVFVNVNLADDVGVVEANADRVLTACVEGGELLAFGSASPRTEERYDSGSFTSCFGRAQAVVRRGNEPLTLTVSAADLGSATLTL